MLFRRFFLGLGTLALIAGLGLVMLSLRLPTAPRIAGPRPVPQQALLTAARALGPGTLLRSDDVKWTERSVATTPAGAFVRGQAGETEVLGAAVRRGFEPGEPIVADGIIRPNESGFLPAVLGPGMRAVSLAFEGAEIGSGLIAPGDHVDIILTQSITGSAPGSPFRSVGETILQDLRVIAVDQTTNLIGPSPAKVAETRLIAPAPGPVPKTVTLEVTARQAEMLKVAQQMGRLQLILRSLSDRGVATPAPPPAWATEVSPALRYFSGGPIPGEQAPGEAARTRKSKAASETPNLAAIDILRGNKWEEFCYSEKTGRRIPCGNAPAVAAGKPGVLPRPAAPSLPPRLAQRDAREP